MDREKRAKIAALSVLQAHACAKLLRAHGRVGHAAHLEAALGEVADILGRHLGHGALSIAMKWANDQMSSGETANDMEDEAAPSVKRMLH